MIDATSRLLRERGAGGMSVQALMAAVGLTQGGFYKHFRSKEQLVDISTARAFTEILSFLRSTIEDFPDRARARAELLRHYLSPEHRDSPATGCANTALASDAARAAAGSPMRAAYATGVEETLGALAECEEVRDDGRAESRRRAIVDLATMVGALTLARGTRETPLSDEILQVVHEALAAQHEPGSGGGGPAAGSAAPPPAP
ncbi:TetR/AcrR family transcriptional regulator [Micromonospora sp. ZYX-F-536]|uniref:TetR/AcrR family transcriptional regulator n=1 Tax=Micromonospora sp. ZYX-F-536 TaxID=3457629 RepID=UPI004040AB21